MKFSVTFPLALVALFPHASLALESWDVLSDVKLPKPVSDHSSTFVPENPLNGAAAGIYIAGGCDSPDGNTYVDANGLELDFFLCESISDELHIFDAETMTFRTSTAKLPQPRYRHAAVHALGMLWLIGGRTPDDSVIAEVDVYDPGTDEWTTVGKIPDQFLTSDNGAFTNADGSTIYVVGGYTPNYFNPDALATTISFESQETMDQQAWNMVLGNTDLLQNLVVTKKADLLQGRGDIHAVSSKDGKKAFVAGGYAGMCQPLASAEVYDMETDTWNSAGDMLKARGDGAMVEASGKIFAIGGEINHPDQCAAPELVPPLAHQSLAVDDVEVLEYAAMTGATTEWADVANIPEFRFRFSAATWPSTGVAYAFGGQTSFDESCKCFPTTSEITAIDSGILLTTSDGPGKQSTSGSSGNSFCEDDDCEDEQKKDLDGPEKPAMTETAKEEDGPEKPAMTETAKEEDSNDLSNIQVKENESAGSAIPNGFGALSGIMMAMMVAVL